jgi:putative transposase
MPSGSSARSAASASTGSVIRNERHLAHVIREYLDHYNRERPHRALGLRPPDPPPQPGTGPIQRLDRLGGLIHHYERTAA